MATSNRTLYEQLLRRFNETRDQQGIVEADARVVAMAAPPAVPSSPGPKMFAAGGFTVSLLLGSLLAVLLERARPGPAQRPRGREPRLGLTTLGLVPRVTGCGAASGRTSICARSRCRPMPRRSAAC